MTWLRQIGALNLGLGMALLAACGHRPPRFADQLPVTRVHDDRGIEQPAGGVFISEFFEADAYVRRELVSGLDPRRPPAALDVNALDEIPFSSWFLGARSGLNPLADYRKDGPPVPPFMPLPELAPESGAADAFVIEDARGLRYELQPDMPGRAGMRTGAAVVASRLLHAVGYRTAEVYIIRSHLGERVAAMRWPIGADLGPTPRASRRGDDANDHLPHTERRSLRVLFHLSAWLNMRRLRPRMLRDSYDGPAGSGHVRHYLVGMDGALGVDAYVDALQWAADADREDHNFFLRVFSLGLSPKPMGIVPATPDPSIGLMDTKLVVDNWDMSPPFEPADRLTPADAYWVAKRLAQLPQQTVARALGAAHYEVEPHRVLRRALSRRRGVLIAHGFDQTTPCEVERVTVDRSKATTSAVELIDLAILYGFVPDPQRSYRVTYLDDEGSELAAPEVVRGVAGRLRVVLPATVADQGYAVLRVLALRRGIPMPRPLDIHLSGRKGAFHLVGVRH